MNFLSISAIMGTVRRDAMDDIEKALRECGTVCFFLEKNWDILSLETRNALMARLEKLLEYAKNSQDYASSF